MVDILPRLQRVKHHNNFNTYIRSIIIIIDKRQQSADVSDNDEIVLPRPRSVDVITSRYNTTNGLGVVHRLVTAVENKQARINDPKMREQVCILRRQWTCWTA